MLKRVIILMLAALLSCAMIAPAMAGDGEGTPPPQGLTIEQAINMALTHSKAIKQAAYDVERREEVRDELARQIDYVPKGQTDYVTGQLYTGLVTSDMAYRMAKKSLTMEEDKVMLAAFKAYTDVVKAGQNLEYAQKSFNQAAWLQNVAYLSFAQGMASEYDKTAAGVQYQAAKNSLDSAQKALDNAFLTLNQLIGKDAEARPVLLDKPAFQAVEPVVMSEKIATVLNTSPSVWLAEQAARIAETQLDLYDFSYPNQDPYGAKEVDVSKAKLTAQDAREQMSQFVRTLYNNLLTMEQGYASLQEAEQLAREDLRIIKLKYEIGMATRTEVQAAELALQARQKSLDELAFQHEAWKIVFDKPWTYSVMVGAGS
ncbi:MAG: TolC family protein [Syntrophomonadaceae bacterium]